MSAVGLELSGDEEFITGLVEAWNSGNDEVTRRLMVYLMSRGMNVQDAADALVFIVAGMKVAIARVERVRR